MTTTGRKHAISGATQPVNRFCIIRGYYDTKYIACGLDLRAHFECVTHITADSLCNTVVYTAA